MTETKHTELPWHLFAHTGDLREENIRSANDLWVGYVMASHDEDEGFPSTEEGIANAEFIVKACNNHYRQEKEIEIYRDLVLKLAGIGLVSEKDGHGLIRQSSVIDLISRARQAIKEAQ